MSMAYCLNSRCFWSESGEKAHHDADVHEAETGHNVWISEKA